MLYHNLSKPLQSRIRKYFQFIHANSVLNENDILNWLSPTLRQDATIQIRAHLVKHVPFLTHIDKVFLAEVFPRAKKITFFFVHAAFFILIICV